MPGKADETYTDVYVRQSLQVATRANGTFPGAAVDTAEKGGSDCASIVVISSQITDGTHVFTVEESADGSTGWTAVPAQRIQGTAPTFVSTDDLVLKEGWSVSLLQRYLRVVCTTSGATTGGVTTACVIVGPSKFAAH